MEVTLVNRSVFSLPSKQRVGCIVHDGTSDMQLWPGPGPDKDLLEAYGADLQRALDDQVKDVEGRELEIPAVARVHPGRLHCNFLAWVATRGPEPGSDRQPAPAIALLKEAVVKALAFASERHVQRIAFPALGGGHEEQDRVQRLVAIVQAAHRYHEDCKEAGRSPGVEEVLVCEAGGPAFRAAKKQVQGLARTAEPKAEEKPAKKKTTRTATRKKTTSKPKLTSDEIATARGAAESYSMRNTYVVGDFLVHPKFGLGKVTEVPAPGAVMVVFEDGVLKRMVHGRA